MQARSGIFLRITGAGLTALLLGICAVGPRSWADAGKLGAKQDAKPIGKPKAFGKKSGAAYTPEDLAAFSARFAKDIWPLLSRNSSGCTTCHTANHSSQLHFVSDADHNFKTLLTDGHFDAENAAGILARLTTPDKTTQMPPAGFTAWTESEIATLRSFVNDIFARRKAGAAREDELFPVALLEPYKGKGRKGADNTFLTYTQLRGKIASIFGDDWRRDDRDLWTDNLAQFGGADFVRSFNESAKPTAQFLSGMDLLGGDVASRAYLAASGPFAGRAKVLPSPLALKAPDAAHEREINRLYQRLLFRDATTGEIAASFRMLQTISQAQKDLAAQDYDLRFELAARDERGLETTQSFRIPVFADRYGLSQTMVNQNDNGDVPDKPEAKPDEKKPDKPQPDDKIARCKLDGPFTLKAGDVGQRMTVFNANTHGNVMVHAIEITGPLPATETRKIDVNDPAVQVLGAWRMSNDSGVACYEDENANKGASSLVFPLNMAKDGQYQITLDWRKDQTAPPPPAAKGKGKGRRRNKGPHAENVLVEVQSQDKHRLAMPNISPIPPKGEAHFTLDESDDTVAFRDLKTTFRFGPSDGVEINNTGTLQRVVADAVLFTPQTSDERRVTSDEWRSASLAPSASVLKTAFLSNAGSGPLITHHSSFITSFMVAAKEAEGQDDWKDYKKSEYTFYRPVGPRVVTDENDGAQKGKLRLFYKPVSHAKEWKANTYYGVSVGYPGEVQNDTAVPIVVHAQASSPIVRPVYPIHAHVGATVTLDATHSYNLQGTNLRYTWRQVSGPQVTLADAHAAKLSFAAPTQNATQAAWEGLCRALLKHPDFLFTRPLARATVRDARTRQHLQLVKIAQDLVGRTPTPSEFAALDKGMPLGKIVDGYLNGKEFQAFYFHRIRLYLESHGTDEDDEPARLWSWIAFHDRPFKDILSADYTINSDWQKTARPAYHGKSGVLTMKGFINGKPGLPHFNYAAQVCEKFLGYVFEVPEEVVKMRDGITAASTTSPSSVCYSCHKILTPLAYQRTQWGDNGEYKPKDAQGAWIDASDHQLVPSYAFKGVGMEAFATQAQNKERFIRTIIQTHFIFLFGREMRWEQDERKLYKRCWDAEQANGYKIKPLLRLLVTSPEYLNGGTNAAYPSAFPKHVNPHNPRSVPRSHNFARR